MRVKRSAHYGRWLDSKTKDRSHSAQYEHQIVVTENGCEVMTIRDEEIAGRSNSTYNE